MTPVQPDLHPASPAVVDGAASRSAPTDEALVQRWLDLHQRAARLARIADLAAEPAPIGPDDLATALASANAWQRGLVEQGIEDIDALMRPGLAALSTIAARRRDATWPALALWREFHAARAAVLAVLDISAADTMRTAG